MSDNEASPENRSSTNKKGKKKKSPEQPLRTVDVIAPSDLPSGYQFYVDSDDRKSLLVVVPKGGVTAGQHFCARVISEADRGVYDIPHGRWRDGLFNCLAFGFFHPQFCLTLWCQLCGLGQVLTRMKLDFLAIPLDDGKRHYGEITEGDKVSLSAFMIMSMIAAVYWFLSIVLSTIILVFTGDDGSAQINEDGAMTQEEGKEEPKDLETVVWIRNVIGFTVFIFAWVITIRARAYVRRKYSIPEGRCGSCEDICCSFWCGACTICQIARHTADYQNHPAGCCSEDGLKIVSQEIV